MYKEIFENTKEEDAEKFGGAIFENLEELCEAHPELSGTLRSMVLHVEAYAGKVAEMSLLEKDLQNPESEKRFHELRELQSEDKDAFIADMRELDKKMRQENISGMLALFIEKNIEKGSAFYSRLMLYLASQLEQE